MILIFEPSPPYVRWCKIENGRHLEGVCEFNRNSFNRVIEGVNTKEAQVIGYVLYHGAEIIDAPVEVIESASLKKLEECVRFSPECNDLTYRVAKYCIRRIPTAKHVLLCDTAFFVNLPQEVSTYAVPYELRKKGIRRYGGQGLCHQWAWKKTNAFSGKAIKRAISVYLGNYTNMVAIDNGNPRETSIGFTSLEGIISATSCGDIDPTIIFQLHATGMSLKAINKLLSTDSGFKAVLGRKCGFADILKSNKNSKEIALAEIYCYNILKYAGAFISVLGGADAAIFVYDRIEEALPFIVGICRKLKFLDLKMKKNIDSKGKELIELTTNNSRVRIFCLRYNKWNSFVDLVKEA